MRTITISGTDGSGKSTQVERLAAHFEAEGQRVFYFHSVQFSIANKVRRGGAKDSGPGAQTAVTGASSSAILLRKIFLRIDIARFRRLLVGLDREGYDLLLSDRYFYDNLVNIAYLERGTVFPRTRPPRPTHSFYLEVDPAVTMGRPRPPEQGLEYLVAKKALYDDLAARLGLTVIDGDRGADAIASDLLDAVRGA